MKCHEAQDLMLHALNGEITRSERELLHAHTAQCEACFGHMQHMHATENLVRESLGSLAAQVTPNPQAWSKLQAALAQQTKPQRSPQPGQRMGWLQMLGATLAVSLFAIGALALGPALVMGPATNALPPQMTSAQPAVSGSSKPSASQTDYRALRQMELLLRTEPKETFYVLTYAVPDSLTSPNACPLCKRLNGI